MKILYIVDYYQPLLGYGSYYIPKELVRLGHKVTILTSDHYYPFPNYDLTAGKLLGPRKVKAGIDKIEGVTVVRKPLRLEVFTRAIFSGQKEYIRKINPDIVIVDKSAGYSAILVSFYKKLFQYKLISIDAHLPSGFKAEGNQFLKQIFYYIFRILFSRLLNNTVDKFIAVQEGTEIIMKKYYGIRKNVVHIPLGTDLELFKYSKKSWSDIRKKYGMNKEDFVIIYTGKIIKEKGVDILFHAFGLLCEKHKSIKLLLVGSGTKLYLKYCFIQIKKDYQKRVILAGFQKAKLLYKYYSASDLGVWPLQESMSMNDAAACEIPFIANNTIGAKFRLSNNNALLYRKNNYRDLSKKIEFLINNPKKAREMGRRGRLLMEKELSWTKIAEKYISFK